MEESSEQKLDLVIELLEDILLELRRSPRDRKRWLTCSELAEQLNISERTIYRLRRDGVFKEGKDFRRKLPENPRSSLIYNLESCEKAHFLVSSGRRLEITP
jgi:excisionase family DNA binding protein